MITSLVRQLLVALLGSVPAADPSTLEVRRGIETQLAIVSVDEVDVAPVFTSPREQHWAGAITHDGDRIIGVNAPGEFYEYRRGWKSARPLPLHYENNRRQFLAEVERLGWKFWPHNFRVTDILVGDVGGERSLFLSTLYWYPDKRCYTLRIVRAKGWNVSPQPWQTIFEASPCVPLQADGWMQGQESGGRLLLGDGVLFATIGHFGIDGRKGQPNLPQDSAASYGKILRIPLDGTAPQIISQGHRNPQGLTVTTDGEIWSTEHGPRGGDELNHIEPGKDYGWPTVTLGTDYTEMAWGEGELGRHAGFEPPVYAWLPSVGISSLLQIHGFMPVWEGDLLAGALGSRSIYRLRLDRGHVVYAEQIPLGERVRDIDQMRDGTLAVLADTGKLLFITPTRGEAAAPVDPRLAGILDRCKSCHSLTKGVAGVMAPGLWGVYGRGVASTQFAGYSRSMRSKGGVWNDAALDELLRAPAQAFPDSVMGSIGGIADDDLRHALIDHLKTLR